MTLHIQLINFFLIKFETRFLDFGDLTFKFFYLINFLIFLLSEKTSFVRFFLDIRNKKSSTAYLIKLNKI